ncbi:helix-turn-helix transcriptional regulator [Thioalkalivibrio sulfidiphilus]|uniref:helix-turn-helix transcriptional regulator n=1 Tax=Thioalkalivibrio sulfidiphilus TaxID=1033854 RepID=UPI003B39E555
MNDTAQHHPTDSDRVTFPRLMTPAEVQQLLGKSKAWLDRSRLEGNGPPYVKIGRTVRYRADDVAAWLNGNVRASTWENRE